MNNADKSSIRQQVDWLRTQLASTTEKPPRRLVAMSDANVDLEKIFGRSFLKTLRPAAVLIPVIERQNGLTVLLTLRSHELRSHAGQVAFPGGRREAGDRSLSATALREAQEEVRLDPDAVRVLGYLDDYPTISKFLVTPVVGFVDANAHFQPDGIEVASTFEVPLELVTDKSRYECETMERKGATFPVYSLEYEGYRIWGATAGMLLNLSEVLLRNNSD